jgi:cytochrome c-type biogenesis protein CcmH
VSALRPSRPALILGAAGMVMAGSLLFAALRSDPATTFDQRVDAVAKGLRCPVCQDLSVADSPSEVALAMRGDIARRLDAGQSAAAIRRFYVARYGPWILLSPDRRGAGWFVWLFPALAVAGGAWLVIVLVRRRPSSLEPATHLATSQALAGGGDAG